ncbi:hypothetical protein GRI89_09100 [Altererythrobacter salegens]|uniref:Uncharacterized protein n=1 Tax=Croceibacterium salegens TaxID=1737568 RepID=A0A6I4SUP1_9SPHN|nr:hypothetical protein [Croceibacterium salegens]MXO59695.1 hypothetical protein [Croceibacterium salegens]
MATKKRSFADMTLDRLVELVAIVVAAIFTIYSAQNCGNFIAANARTHRATDRVREPTRYL